MQHKKETLQYDNSVSYLILTRAGYCQNHQNGVTSCFPKMVIKMKKKEFVLIYQNLGCKLLKFGYSEKATQFEKIFHVKFDVTE